MSLRTSDLLRPDTIAGLCFKAMRRGAKRHRNKYAKRTGHFMTHIESCETRIMLDASDVLINEIIQNPAAVSDSDGEWVELFNSGATDVDIDGWVISDNDTDTHTINNGGPLIISAGGYLILGRNADMGTNGGVNVDYQYSDFFLSNSADEVVLTDNMSNEIDRVEYDGGPNFPDPTGASMALLDPALDNNVSTNWATSDVLFGDGDLGTPGAVNFPPATPGVTLTESAGSTVVAEGGATDTYTLVLDTIPTDDVTITVTPDAQLDVGAGAGVATNVVITVALWDQPVTITVTAVDDAAVEGAHNGTITHTVASPDTDYNGATVPDVVAAITDNDAPALIPPYMNDFESNTGVAGFGEGWQVFSVDGDGANTWFAGTDGDRHAEVNAFGNSAAANDWLISPEFNLDTTDNEFANFNTYTRFADSGQGDPEVTFLYSTDYIGSGDPSVANWTNLPYNAPAENSQVDTDSGNIDISGIMGTSVYFAFQYQSSGTGPSDSSLWRVDDFEIGITPPNDVIITETDGTTDVTEGDLVGDQFDVALASLPAQDVTVTVTPDGETDLGSGAGVAIDLTFTPTNGTMAQTVTVVANDDMVVEGNHTSTITFTVASADTNYDGLVVPDLTVNVTDNDAVPVTELLINEVDADTAGSDTLEFVELFGTPNGSLDGHVLVFFNGSSDTSYQAFDLDGQLLDANGYFVIGNAAVANVDLVIADNSLQNGADAVAVYQADGTDFPGGTAVTTTNLIDAVVYDTNDGDDAGLLVLLNAAEPQLNEDENADKDNHSLQRIPNGSGGARNTSSFMATTPTPGAENISGATPGISLTESTGTTEVAEGGATDTYTLVLDTIPTDDVTITVTPDAQLDVGAGAGVATNVVITVALWDQPVTITVTAADDAAVEGAHNGTITHTVASPDADYNGATVPDVVAAITDNDAPALIPPYMNDFESNTGVAGFGEGWQVFSVDGDGANTWFAGTDGDRHAEVNGFGDSAAANDWLISPEFNLDTTDNEFANFNTYTRFADSGQGDPEVTFLYSTDYSGSGDPSLANWTILPYTAPAPDSQTDTDSGNIDISGIMGTSVYFAFQYQSSGTGAGDTSLWRVDDFVIGITPQYNVIITETDGTTDVTEGDLVGDQFDVALASLPAQDVTVTVTPDGETDLGSGAGVAIDLTFTPTNGTMAQTVTVVANDDLVVEGNHTSTITFTVASADTNYDGLVVPDLTANVTDNDTVPVTELLINEVDADTAGSDTLEFVELFGTPNGDLNGYVLVLFNGSSDTSYQAFDLDGQFLDANGYFVIGNAAVANVDLVISNNSIQNGADAVAVYQADGTDFPSGTAVTTTNLIDAVVYDTNDADDAGLLVLLNAAEPQLNEDENADKDNHSLQRIPNGSGGARNTSTFAATVPTPGVENMLTNLPPMVALQNTVTMLPEDADTTLAMKVADIVVTDDGLGTNVLSLSGTDAALFEIAGNELFLIAGAMLNFDTNPVLDVTIEIDDSTLGAFPDDSDSLSIQIQDVNLPPHLVLTHVTSTLPENVDNQNRIFIEQISVFDPDGGTTNLSLSGPDAGLFEIIGDTLFLIANAMLDIDTNPVLNVTVSVDDPGIGAGPEDSVDVNVVLTDPTLNPLPELGSSMIGLFNGNWWLSRPDESNNYSFILSVSTSIDASRIAESFQGDFNGDGIEDIAIMLDNGIWLVGLIDVNGQMTLQEWITWRTNDVKEIHVGDFNADGMTDIAGVFRSGDRARIWVYESTGTEFLPDLYGSYANYDGITTMLVGNFDGVNGDDIAIFNTAGVWWVGKSDTAGTRFTYGRPWSRWRTDRTITDFNVGDFNGDGVDDISAVFDIPHIPGDKNVFVGLSNSTRFVTKAWKRITVTETMNAFLVGDFNGDDATDFAVLLNDHRWWVGLSDTVGSFNYTSWGTTNNAANTTHYFVGNSNADGLADIFTLDINGDWYSQESTGTAFGKRMLDDWAPVNWEHVKVGSFAAPPIGMPPQASSENESSPAASDFETFGSNEFLELISSF